MKRSQYKHILEDAGLTELEAGIYLFVLERGIVTVPQIHKGLGTDKSSTYRVVENLVSRKLLTPLGEEYGQQYTVSDPQYLIEMAEERTQEAKVVLGKISSLVESFSVEGALGYKRENISVYEGAEGYRAIMNKKLEVGEDIFELGNAAVLPQTNPDYWNFVEKFVKKRVKAGIRLRGLVRTAGKSQKFEQTDPKLLKQVKYLPDSMEFGASVSTFGEYTGIISHTGTRQLAILIKDPVITGLITALLEYIWNTLP